MAYPSHVIYKRIVYVYPVPAEQMAAVRAGEDELLSPPGGLLNHRPGVPVAAQRGQPCRSP